MKKRWDVSLSFLSEQNAADVRRQISEACDNLPGVVIEYVELSGEQDDEAEEEDVTSEEDVEEETK